MRGTFFCLASEDAAAFYSFVLNLDLLGLD